MWLSTASSYESRRHPPSLPVLQDHYQHLSPAPTILRKSGECFSYPSPILRRQTCKTNWQTSSGVRKLKVFQHKYKFPNIVTLVKLILTLPHPYEKTGRMFSTCGDENREATQAWTTGYQRRVPGDVNHDSPEKNMRQTE